MILTKTTASEFAVGIDRTLRPIQLQDISKADIARRIQLGFPKSTKLEKIESFLKSDTDGIAYIALLNRMLDILSKEKFDLKRLTEYRSLSVYLETSMNKSLLRDAVQGLINELMHEVVKDKNKTGLLAALNTASQRDLVFSMILITKEQATTQDSNLRTRERELFKHRMRQMNDTEREATKMLLDIGIAPYIITNQDREIFAREYNLPDQESSYEQAMQDADVDRPEYGNNDVDTIEGLALEEENGAINEQNREYENLTEENYDEGYGV
jgi:hypothetical protein